jgi:thiamine biosynthesis lipoprotein
MKRFVLVLFLLRTSAVLAGTLRLETSADAMGSTFSLVLYGEDRRKMEAASNEVFDEVRRLDNLLSHYKPDSEWSKVNREAADHPVRVSKELFDLLQACVEYSRQSEGTFDITVGPLMKLWGFFGSEHAARAPRPVDVAETMKRMGYQNIVLDQSSGTVAFARKGIELDPGGVGKGYAVDRAVEILRKDNINSGLVSAGGSSIYAIGTPPGEAGWEVRIEDPLNPRRTAAVATLKDESLSTSGISEKFFVAEGQTWSHIMDPRTGYPARGTLAVSVIAPRTLDSEVWAKPYFIQGRQWTNDHKPRDFRVFFCEEIKDKVNQPCVWLP